MATTFIERGLKIVSGCTENHLMLVDLIGKSYTGKDADEALGYANITVNKMLSLTTHAHPLLPAVYA